jgi:hypothetical protein
VRASGAVAPDATQTRSAPAGNPERTSSREVSYRSDPPIRSTTGANSRAWDSTVAVIAPVPPTRTIRSGASRVSSARTGTGISAGAVSSKLARCAIAIGATLSASAKSAPEARYTVSAPPGCASRDAAAEVAHRFTPAIRSEVGFAIVRTLDRAASAATADCAGAGGGGESATRAATSRAVRLMAWNRLTPMRTA